MLILLFLLALAAKIYISWRLLPLRFLVPALRKRNDPKHRVICDPIAEHARSWLTRRWYIKRFQLLPARAPLDRSGMAQQWNWLWWNIQFCNGETCPAQGICNARGCCQATSPQK